MRRLLFQFLVVLAVVNAGSFQVRAAEKTADRILRLTTINREVSLRTQPGSPAYETKIAPETPVQIVEPSIKNRTIIEDQWYQVAFQGETGWLLGEELKFDEKETAVYNS